MGFPPKIGEAVMHEHQAKKAEVLGEIRAKGPAYTGWTDEEAKAVIELEEGPPPWETEGMANPSDARNFIDCPREWVLYWINPKVLDATGWRGWKPVMASDPRVKVKIPAMRSVEGNIRRGGHGGDILGYMPRHWYESRKRLQAEVTTRQTQSSVEKLQQLKEEFRHGKYPNITLESAQHPTHTMGDGRTMTDP